METDVMSKQSRWDDAKRMSKVFVSMKKKHTFRTSKEGK